MNNADRQVLRAIQKGPHGVAAAKLAEIVEGLAQTVEALREQVAQQATRPPSYVDYLPEMRAVLAAPAVAYHPEDENAPKAGGA